MGVNVGWVRMTNGWVGSRTDNERGWDENGRHVKGS